MEYELKITGGTIVDGTGAPAFRGDVGIAGGRLTALGETRGRAWETIDATGKVVAPGFIDVHTHYDAQILWDRMLTISPWHGVTTVVMGNCGFGVAPTRPAHRRLILRTLEKVEGMSLEALEAGVGLDWRFESFPDYLDAIERCGPAINVAAFVGHTPVRLYVMGEEATERAATDAEIARMRTLVRGALDAGAIGFATSKAPTHVGYDGRPVPSRAAELSEILAIAATLGEAGHGILQTTIGPGLFVDELETLARQIGRPITWTALLAGMFGPGCHRPILEQTRSQSERGLSIIPQVACRPLNFEFDLKEPLVLESLPLFQPIAAADVAGKQRLYADPDFRRAARDVLGPNAPGPFLGAWERTRIAYCPTEPALEERTVAEVARERGVDPVDLVFDLGLASGLTARFRMAVVNYDENEVAELLSDPGTVLGLSDAGAHASQLCDACFATHLLGRWVRERGVLGLEQAVHMLTGRPAAVLNLTDRGRLALGWPGDVVVFDPQTIAPSPLRRVSDLPAGADRLVADAVGIDAVIVNGRMIRRAGADVLDANSPLPGRLLRSGRARA